MGASATVTHDSGRVSEPLLWHCKWVGDAEDLCDAKARLYNCECGPFAENVAK